jgi:hypothetical protein
MPPSEPTILREGDEPEAQVIEIGETPARPIYAGHVAFIGDADRLLKLTPVQIVELERLSACGIGALCRRLFAGDFNHADVVETIRLSLIGGGTSPKEAAALVAAYIAPAPLAENYALAVEILDRLWHGSEPA